MSYGDEVVCVFCGGDFSSRPPSSKYLFPVHEGACEKELQASEELEYVLSLPAETLCVNSSCSNLVPQQGESKAYCASCWVVEKARQEAK